LWSIFFGADADKDTLITYLWERGTCGIIEEAGGVRAFFEDETNCREIAADWAVPPGEIELEAEIDCAAFQREGWEPLLVGDRFFIAPPWVQAETPQGRLRLEIDASTAFGTGRHESTQLCLQALEKHLKHGDTVLDVGCGSGILIAAAERLGAGQTFGCDISVDALTIARLHVHGPLFAGSADAVTGGLADITLANISAAVVDRLATELKRITKPGGLVILAGFIRDTPPRCFRFTELLEEGEWQCWVCSTRDIDAAALGEDPPAGVHSERWWL